MNDQLEREEDYLHEQFADGHISREECDRELKELHYDYQGAAQEAAEEAYRSELEGW